MPVRTQQGMPRTNPASPSLVPFKTSLFSCWSVGELQSPSPPPPSRRRKRSPETAIPPRSRKRMRPSEHALRTEASGSGHGLREEHERAPSPSPSFSAEYDFDDEEEEDDLDEEEYSRTTERGSMAGHFAHEPTSASANSTNVQQQKPKRTRQLTTPHQSAVLHALLAQSRFPTTAMREEVGRQIGLSARRVQVWFQNQRQKARKGTKDAAAAAATTVGSALPRDPGPPQFGPFTNAPPLGPSGAPGSSYGESSASGRPTRGPPRPQAGESSASPIYEHAPGSSYSSFPISDHYGLATMSTRRVSEPSTDIHVSTSTGPFRRSSGDALTGPGVPGSSASVDPFPQSGPAPSSIYSRPISPGNPLRLPPVHSITPPLGRREGRSTPSSAAYESEQDLSPSSLRLPPLQLGPRDTHRNSSDASSRAPHGSSRGSHIQYSSRSAYTGSTTLPRSSVITSASSRGSGDFSPSSRSPPPIPPPFTLEPNPVWPSSSSSSARNRTLTGLSSYAALSSSSSRQPQISGEVAMIERRTLPAPTRTMRFDPVRNTNVPPSHQPYRAHSRSPEDNN